jgi:hypothetical protein
MRRRGFLSVEVLTFFWRPWAGEDFGPDHGRGGELKALLLETHTLSNQEKIGRRLPNSSLWVAGSHQRCCMLAYCPSVAWSSPSSSRTCFCSICRSPFGLCWGDRSLVTSVDMAEGQPAAQTAAVQKKEPKKLSWKKSDIWFWFWIW